MKAHLIFGLGIDCCIETVEKRKQKYITRAFSMYEKAGFIEYGRNPKGFNSRKTGFQEVIHMRLEL